MRRENDLLAAAPHATVAHGAIGVMLSINDQATRQRRPLADGEVLDLGGKRLRRIETPQIPHCPDAGLFFEEVSGTLLCGDLFTQTGTRAPGTRLALHSAAFENRIRSVGAGRRASAHSPGITPRVALRTAQHYDSNNIDT